MSKSYILNTRATGKSPDQVIEMIKDQVIQNDWAASFVKQEDGEVMVRIFTNDMRLMPKA